MRFFNQLIDQLASHRTQVEIGHPRHVLAAQVKRLNQVRVQQFGVFRQFLLMLALNLGLRLERMRHCGRRAILAQRAKSRQGRSNLLRFIARRSSRLTHYVTMLSFVCGPHFVKTCRVNLLWRLLMSRLAVQRFHAQYLTANADRVVGA
ncbi:hypothetical protein [Collimonas arenae]|uniref:hypothetical protein n=1 Tax=Collimonas arenae TaxID=279058 RepID=UPI001F36F299|nr:hypothetical protein [Collimonas arenae]